MTETVEQRNTYRIHESNLTRAFELIGKINRKARRLGLAEYEKFVGEPIELPVFPEVSFGRGIPEPIGYETYYDVEVIGEMPRIEGWSFVATLDYSEEGGVITRVVPGVEIDLSAHRVRTNECDHCGTIRHRNETYVLLNTDTGATMQVGSTCIQPYMGLSASALGWIAGEPMSEMSEYEEREPGYRSGPTTYDVDAILVTTMAVEQVEGWVSRTVASEYGKRATADIVLFMMEPPRTDKDRIEQARISDAADWDAAKEKAAKVKAWAIADSVGYNEWRENVRQLAKQQRVTFRNVGVLASAVAGYNRDQGDRVKREARGPVEYVGKPGDKIEITGEVVTTYAYENSYSPYGAMSEIVVIRAEGALFKWNSSSTTEFEAGDKVTGKATVKKHEEYRGDRQTVITRAKLSKV